MRQIPIIVAVWLC